MKCLLWYCEHHTVTDGVSQYTVDVLWVAYNCELPFQIIYNLLQNRRPSVYLPTREYPSEQSKCSYDLLLHIRRINIYRWLYVSSLHSYCHRENKHSFALPPPTVGQKGMCILVCLCLSNNNNSFITDMLAVLFPTQFCSYEFNNSVQPSEEVVGVPVIHYETSRMFLLLHSIMQHIIWTAAPQHN